LSGYEVSETAIFFHLLVFVSTEDAAYGIFLPDMQKGLERERGI
jgi:hypothetical protein